MNTTLGSPSEHTAPAMRECQVTTYTLDIELTTLYRVIWAHMWAQKKLSCPDLPASFSLYVPDSAQELVQITWESPDSGKAVTPKTPRQGRR